MPGLVSPGSAQVKKQAEAEGLAEVFAQAGLEWAASGCSMCVGMTSNCKGSRSSTCVGFSRCASLTLPRCETVFVASDHRPLQASVEDGVALATRAVAVVRAVPLPVSPVNVQCHCSASLVGVAPTERTLTPPSRTEVDDPVGGVA